MKKITEDKRYQEIATSLNTLLESLGKIEARLTEIDVAVRAHATYDHHAIQVADAVRYAETGNLESATVLDGWQREHTKLVAMAASLNLEIEAKRGELNTLRGALSAELCQSRKAEHRKMAARAADLIEKLDELMGEEEAFVREIERAGYNVAFGERVQWPSAGRLRDKSESMAWYFHRDMALYGRGVVVGGVTYE